MSQESRVHFLGYSTGGYVALVLLLSDAEGISGRAGVRFSPRARIGRAWI